MIYSGSRFENGKVIECLRPNRAAYQVVRYVDGPKLMLTCTRRGKVSLWRLVVRERKHGLVEVPERISEPEEQCLAIERMVAMGYDVAQISAELITRAAKRAA